MRIMKCGYNHCKYNGEVEKSKAVKSGTRYYHKECINEKENKVKIRDLYIEKVDNCVVVKNLSKVINDIINGKNVESDYLLFVLNYIIANKCNLNAPMGLHYYLGNKQIKEEWNKQQIRLQKISIQQNMNDVYECNIDFEYKGNEDKHNWDNILC